MASLRKELQNITREANTAAHASAIDALQRRIPHCIEVVKDLADDLRYNCVMHALGVAKDEELIALVWRCPRDVHPSTQFLKFLKDRGTLVAVKSAAPGVIVVYSNSRAIRHAGRVIADSEIESKWGIGHLYRHALMEIPSSYGSKVEFFAQLDRESVIKEFVTFAKAQGARL